MRRQLVGANRRHQDILDSQILLHLPLQLLLATRQSNQRISCFRLRLATREAASPSNVLWRWPSP